MSIKNREVPFTLSDFDGSDTFPGIRELGFNERGGFVVSAWMSPPPEPRGTYFTSLPISPLEYRRKHGPHSCSYRRDGDRLILCDDWGKQHSISAGADVLDTLVAECIANEIPAAPSDTKETGPVQAHAARDRGFPVCGALRGMESWQPTCSLPTGHDGPHRWEGKP